MRQLSGLDASFVYLEAPRAPMHIGSVAIYDPCTAPSGTVTFKGILEHITSRMPLVPSYREKLLRGPARPRPPVLGQRSRLRPRVPRPPHRPAQAGRLAPAVHPGRPPARPRPRPRPPAVGVLRDRGARQRRRRAAGLVRHREQDAPRRHRRCVGRRDDGRDPRRSPPIPRRSWPSTSTGPSGCRTPSSCSAGPA